MQDKAKADEERRLQLIQEASESKSVIDEQQSFDDDEEDEAQFVDDFEHLSQFDPDDMFLQSEKSFSIIDSIVSGV